MPPATRSPPGPPGGYLGGHIRAFERDRLGSLTGWAREHGDVVELRFGPRRSWIVSDPELIGQVLLAPAGAFRKDRFTRDLRGVLGKGLLTSDGEFWRRQRSLAQPAFHRRRVEGYAGIMVESAARTLQAWRPGEVRDVHADMMPLTLDIVGRTLFGADLAAEARVIGGSLTTVLDYYRHREQRPLLMALGLPSPGEGAFRAAVRRLDQVVFGIIEQRRSGKAKGGEDLLAMLLEAQDEEGAGMTDRQLRDEMVTLLLAGHETTAIALSWTWWLLARHPQVDERLAAELADLGGAPPGIADLPRLRYTEAVLKEAMRLYPPAWLIGREALRDGELGGYPFRRGHQMLMSQWVVHRDPRWHSEPLAFTPERWLPPAVKDGPSFAYFPFGGGPRSCLGEPLAWLEGALILATLTQRWRVAPVPGAAVQRQPLLTLQPRGGLPLVLRARRS
jgi:cytochrome P450